MKKARCRFLNGIEKRFRKLDCDSREFDQELVALNLNTGGYFLTYDMFESFRFHLLQIHGDKNFVLTTIKATSCQEKMKKTCDETSSYQAEQT